MGKENGRGMRLCGLEACKSKAPSHYVVWTRGGRGPPLPVIIAYPLSAPFEVVPNPQSV
ncbi:uncharacterized protein G2W53_034555 [Senna tora]|uniref:Uncharacterized protein n=1 Tax=Senna tora TaxID=362788 RepID=A0A834T0I2_9FABA|nr:uncharacterized protein G2W53_034555 [Senna tora]